MKAVIVSIKIIHVIYSSYALLSQQQLNCLFICRKKMHCSLNVMKRTLGLWTMLVCKSSAWRYLKCLLDLANNKQAGFLTADLLCYQRQCQHLDYVDFTYSSFPISALTLLVGDRKDISPIKHICHLSLKDLFWNKWQKRN